MPDERGPVSCEGGERCCPVSELNLVARRRLEETFCRILNRRTPDFEWSVLREDERRQGTDPTAPARPLRRIEVARVDEVQPIRDLRRAG